MDLHPCHAKSLTHCGDFGMKKSRISRRVVGVERAQQVVAALRCIPVPQRTQFRERRVVPVDTQVDQRESFPAPRPADVHCAPGRARRPRRGLLPARTAAVRRAAPPDRPERHAASRRARVHRPGCCRSRNRPARRPRWFPACCVLHCGPRCCPRHPLRRSVANGHAAWTRRVHPLSVAPSSPSAAVRARVAPGADRCDAG